ncbi:MAG: hypothetical protein EXS05_17125 [Planctomycetaceae bacterium]|nr:hypothetical protein [Planctomycetaceae bacterium]
MTDATLLYRQVHPTFIQSGRVTSQVFRPTPKDEGRLSAYDGDLIDAKASWRHYTETLGFKSNGVMALLVKDCEGEQLPVISDPTPFPEHVVIDFAGYNEKEIVKRSKRLKARAESHGWQYRPEEVT